MCVIYAARPPKGKDLMQLLSIHLGEPSFDNGFTNDTTELEIIRNMDYDKSRQYEFPDGFQFFPYRLEVEFTEEGYNELVIKEVNSILSILWNNGIAAVATSNYEDKLMRNGGYKDNTLPWPQQTTEF